MQSQTENHTIYYYADEEQFTVSPELYNLDITVSKHKISMLVFQSGAVVAIKYIEYKHNLFEMPAALNNLANELAWHNLGFNQIRLIVDSPVFSLVPEPLFDASKAKDYLTLIHQTAQPLHTAYHKTGKHQSILVWALPYGVYNTIQQVFKPTLTLHAVQVFLDNGFKMSASQMVNQLLVHYSPDSITVGYLLQQEIKYLNTFTIDADTDMIYYLISVAAQLKLQEQKFGVVMMGEFSSNSASLPLMKKYIPHVQLMKRWPDIVYPEALRTLPEHQQFLNLHSLVCE